MSKPVLILLSGKKGTGKDTFASYFKYFENIALADALKSQLFSIINEILNVTPKIMLGDMYSNKDLIINTPLEDGNKYSIRYWLQQYGQWMKKIFGLYYWCDIVIKTIRENFPDRNIIVTDIRFPYEIQRLKEELSDSYSIYTIRITRKTGFVDNDSSETSFDICAAGTFDFIIDNNGSLEDLDKKFEETTSAMEI